MNRDVKLLFTLFTLSGFTGLIYESVWSHYLRLFLGAAAFSQSFVLAAFMGGMALGALAREPLERAAGEPACGLRLDRSRNRRGGRWSSTRYSCC